METTMQEKLPIPLLGEDAQKAFDAFLRESAKAKKGYQAGEKAKEHKTNVIDLMGDARLARLPDGRLIQRIPKSRNMPAKGAHVQQWEELSEVALTDTAA
jgi:hypothetical protein